MKPSYRALCVLIVLALVALALASCGGQGQPPASTDVSNGPTLANVNELDGWKVSTDANGSSPLTLTPGNPMVLTLFPGGAAYKNDYVYRNLGGDPALTTFQYCASWRIPNAVDLNRFQAVEADFDSSDSAGWNYTGGLQFLSARGGGPAVRVFDMAGQAWHVVAGASMPLVDTEYHKFCYSFTRNVVAKSTTYTGLTLDGVNYAMGQVYGARNAGWALVLNLAVQLDGDSAGDSYTVHVKDWNASYK